MPVDWKATVQRSVTKSTTEAELLALSIAGSELEWWFRVFDQIHFKPKVLPTLYCDNLQTVAIVNKSEDRLHTKLRHVDTHQMWLRQEAEHGRIHVQWLATNQMPADGLTKSLVRQSHNNFIRQLGLTDVSYQLEGMCSSESILGPDSFANWY
jgi:hypothetical protein